MSNGTAKPDWDDGPAVEAWTNLELDNLPHWAAQQHPLYSRTLTNEDGTPLYYPDHLPTEEKARREWVKEAKERGATEALTIAAADPKMADVFKAPSEKGGRRKGPVYSPFITRMIDLQVKELKKVIKQIWKVAYGQSNRGDIPPNAADIVLRRFHEKYGINLDPTKIGATLKDKSEF